MEELAYSSTAAFLAHSRILGEAAAARDGVYPLSPREREILEAMNRLMGSLTPEERRILVADSSSGHEEHLSGEARRRWERAQLKLRRLLLAKGILSE
jgi:hypothetical protein